MANRWINLSDDEIDHIVKHTLHGSILDDKIAIAICKKLIKAQRKITVASAKGKGRELQQWVCRQIAKVLEINYDQQDDQCEIHSREMGQAGVDVVLRGFAAKWLPFSIECKSTEGLDFKGAVDQAKANQGKGTGWLVFHRRKSLPGTLVIMDAEAFFSMAAADVSVRKITMPRPAYLVFGGEK